MSRPVPVCVLLLVLAGTAAAKEDRTAIIPRPNHLVRGRGELRLSADTLIVAPGAARPEGEILAAALRPATGYPFTVVEATPTGADMLVVMALDPRLANKLGDEGYDLEVTQRAVNIRAATTAGLFYGGQTLRQLLPPAINGPNVVSGLAWTTPAVNIVDRPRFAFRGALLDPARHFIPLAKLEKLVDAFAFHKLNRLHLHLTDDQGWRLQISPSDATLAKGSFSRGQFDDLTRVGSVRRETQIGRSDTLFDGAMRFDRRPHEGYYTRSDIAELVAYARARHIQIIPEIEMPGHATAAIAANPWLGNNPRKQLDVSTHWGVHDTILNPSERTIAFMKVILSEVMEMFPDSRIIHIGGDEAPKDEWKKTHAVAKKRAELEGLARLQEVLAEGPLDDEEQLQAYLVREMAKHVAANGRILGAWDEVLDANLPLPTDLVAIWSWRDIRRGVAAAKAGHPVVMVPTDRTYFDCPPTGDVNEPIGQPKVLTLEQAYLWNRDPDPVPDDLTPEEAKNIRGTIAAFWGEYAYDFDTLQYFIFTRLPAFAEAAWTDEKQTEKPAAFGEFLKNVVVQERRYDGLGLRYQRPDAVRTRVRDLPP